MIGGHINGWSFEQESLGQTALFFGDAGESLQLLGVYDREIRPGFGGAVEEEDISDFANSEGQPEGPESDVGDSEDGFDVRDICCWMRRIDSIVSTAIGESSATY
jgi:hypothetical protein